MRKIAAHYLFDGKQFRKEFAVVVDDTGVVLDIISLTSNKEIEGLEFYNGILCPGFVNAHCHLELSFLRNQLKRHTKLSGFIEQIKNINRRNLSVTDLDAIEQADRAMYNEGIVVCADIVNTSLSLTAKKKSLVYYYNFIELFSVNDDEDFEVLIANAHALGKLFTTYSITPHAPYSVAKGLLQRIISTHSDRYSIHFKESDEENLLFFQFQQSFKQVVNKDEDPSLAFVNFLPKSQPVLFIHNTYLTEQDLHQILQTFENPYFVLCPKSNLFIENTLPPLHLIKQCPEKVCLGTDSLASNAELSIVEEIKTLSLHYPEIPLSSWLSMATINGAKALGIENTFGSVEKGKKPGIVLLENLDLMQLQLTCESFSRRLV